MIEQETIRNCVNKHYSAFAEDIKETLHAKLCAHPEIEKYQQDIDHIDRMKTVFAEINNG